MRARAEAGSAMTTGETARMDIDLLTGGFPSRAALRLVERKMGWGRNGT